MTDLFEMWFLYEKGTIAKHLNKSNQISERAILNIVVTESPLKFENCSVEAPHKIKTTKKNN